MAYVTSAPVNPFYNLLGGIKPSKFSSDQDILQLTRNGLPKRILLALAKKISITFQELANIMHISERTLQRYDDDAIIKTEYAEKAIELARRYGTADSSAFVNGVLDRLRREASNQESGDRSQESVN